MHSIELVFEIGFANYALSKACATGSLGTDVVAVVAVLIPAGRTGDVFAGIVEGAAGFVSAFLISVAGITVIFVAGTTYQFVAGTTVISDAEITPIVVPGVRGWFVMGAQTTDAKARAADYAVDFAVAHI
jgi:hypothetical protein